MAVVAQQQQATSPGPTLLAEFTRLRFHNDESGFAIATVIEMATGLEHTIKGVFATLPRVGSTYAFTGEWVDDPNYGRQLNVETARIVIPTDETGLRTYLVEHAKFVGDTIARAIIAKYGENTLDVLKSSPARVADDIAGLSRERADVIAQTLLDNEAAETLEIALAALLAPAGIGPALRRRVALSESKALEGDKVAIITDNPYVLTRVDGIGFLKADMVGRRLGLAPTHPKRVAAGIAYTLDELTRKDGHVRIPASTLDTAAAAILTVDVRLVQPAIVEMVNKGELVGASNWNVYLPPAYRDEQFIAEKLRALLPVEGKRLASDGMPPKDVKSMDLADDQLGALINCVGSGVFVLTGAPGTGKTFTVRRILDSFPNALTALCAPTGKAAKRLSEMTGQTATTIHRLLGPARDPKTGAWKFEHNVYNKLSADLIVVDEFSMVDNWLAARLLEAINVKTRLVIVGDHYQLPSVGPGNVLRDIIASGVIPTVELTTIKRQDAGYIVRSCHSIKGGGDIVAASGAGTADLQFIDVPNASTDELEVSRRVVHYVGMFRRTGWDAMKQVQVITALREKTSLGCAALNAQLQRLLNSGAATVEGTPFRVGDKVIQTRNDYEFDIVNGDIGYVDTIYTEGRNRNKIVVNFENPTRKVMLPLKANALELAYAVTCHKFQGSECDVVIIPIHGCLGNVVVQRSWLYTAISRAKRCCVLVGDRGEVEKIVGRTRSQDRWTGLVEALQR